MKKLVIAVGAALGIAVIAPTFVGGVIETKYNDILDQMAANPSLELVESQFTKEWFSGVSIVRFKFAGDIAELKQFEIVVKENISFGPIIYDDNGLSFNLARSNAKLSFDGDVINEEMMKAINEHLTISSKVSYGMDYLTSFHMKEITQEQDGNSFKIGAISGDMTLSDEKYFDTDIRWQGLNFNGPNAKVVVSGATITSAQELVSGSFYSGNALSIGDVKFEIPEISVKTPANTDMFSIADLSMSLDSGIENNLVDMTINYGAKEIEVAEQVYKNANLNIDFKKLDADVLLELNNMLTQMSQNQDPQAMTLATQKLSMVATKLLEKDPEISITDLSVETPDGKIQSDAIVSIDNKIYDPQNPMSLMAALKADAKGSAPALFFEKFGLKAMLDMYVEQGLLVRDNAELSFKVQFEQGKLNVNGNPMPLM